MSENKVYGIGPDGHRYFAVGDGDRCHDPDCFCKLPQPSGPVAPEPHAQWMKLPYNSNHPNFNEFHIRDAWCEKARCVPVCDPDSVCCEGGRFNESHDCRKSNPREEAVRRLCEAAKLADHKLRKWGEMTVREMLRAALADVEAAGKVE